jgi:phospholipase C
MVMRRDGRVFNKRAAGAVAGAALAALIALFALSGGGTAAGGATPVPIHHVVVILQENHTFDNVLGQLCAKEKPTTCKFATSGLNRKGETIPLSLADDKVPPVAHGQEAQLTAMHNGKMNGFEQVGGCEEKQCYTAFGEEHVKNLWEMARKGAIGDRFFSRDIVPSWGGHLDFFAQTLDGFVGNNPKFHDEGQGKGPGWGCDSHEDSEWIAPGSTEIKMEPSCVPDKEGNGAYRKTEVQYVPTVADRIEEAGLTWGIYAAQPGEQEGSKEERESAGPYKWAICPTFAECLDGPQKDSMHEAKQLFSDAATGNLPNFSILTPTTVTGGTSQHNGTSMGLGDEYIAQEVRAIQEGPDGASTTIFIYYDDCGCFYDHLKPPRGLGIRLPLVIVSPYAKPGFVDDHVATNSSILAYMENVLHVAPVDELDANAYNFSRAFNYKQKPTEPLMARKDEIPRADRHLPPPPPDAS